MFTSEMVDKVDSFLHQNFPIIYDFEFNGLLLFWGGAIKSIIMGTPVNDLDFVLLTQEDNNILDFINKYKLNYKKKVEYVYVIKYKNYFIDLSFKNDLLCDGYNTDMIFYDIHRKQFIPISIKQAIEKRQVIIYGYHGYPRVEKRKHNKDRLNTAKKFIQFMSNDNRKVKLVRKNKYYIRMFMGFLKHPSKILKLFRR